MTIKKLLFVAATLLIGGGSVQGQPTASTPAVGNTYYLYNPATKLFMTTNVDLPFIRPTGSAWKLEAADGHDGWITLRLKDSSTDGEGYFWGKWWANNPNGNSASYADERVYQLVNISGNNYKLKSYAWGATDAYIYINKGNEGDRSYRLACNSQDQAGLDDGYVTWQFISEADYATYMADDYTSRISNNDFLNGTANWTLEGSGNKQAHGNTAIEYWTESAASGSFDFYQTLTNLPAGKYVLRAAMYNSTNGEKEASFNTEGQCGVYGTSNGTTKSALVTEDGTTYNIYTTDGILVPDGNLRVGFKNVSTMTARWFGVDWIQLSCVEYCLSTVATELPANGAMAADTWYYYNLPSSDDYDFTSSDGTTLTYTSDGTQLVSEATGTATTFTASETKEISLPAGRVYFKTGAPTTLTISYKYNVGSATADASCIQTGNTVTVSYASLGTNDPSASLSKDFSGVTFNGASISVTPTANGFTFVVPTVTTNASYTLSIPANAIGYADAGIYNVAQNIEFNTPVLPDGTYYFKAAATYDGTNEGTSAAVGKYLSRGTAYGTHLSLDSYGLPVVITTNGSNQTILKMADTNSYVFSTGSYDAYADGSDAQKTSFSISIQNGKYLIASNNRGASKYLKYNTANADDEEISVFDDGTGTNAGPIIMWTIESISEHTTAMQAKKDNQVAAAAAAAYASGNYASLNGITTIADLESELTANYIAGEFVSPTTISSVEESYQPRNNSSGNLVPVTVYSNTIEITQPGFYKFSMQAFNRATWNENVQKLHEAGADLPAAALFFGDSETQIKSLYDEVGHDAAVEGADPADVSYNGKYYANCKASALKMFKDDKYHNDVWFYCSTPGTYTYGVKIMGYANGQWFIYSPESVTITSYASAATSEDYTALANAISAYDAATWGFQAGEYAPYNNLLAINNIDAAKAIDPSATNSKLLVNSLTSYLSLTANAAEVNAIYWKTDYTTADKTGDYVNPIGWTNVGYNTRIMNSELTADAAMSTIGTAIFSKFNTTYGETTGYTMPLKAGKIYKISFKYCGWGNNPTTNVVLTDPENNIITLAPGFRPATSDGNSNAEHWYDYVGYFVSTTAGDYVLAMNKVESGQQQIAWADMQLVSATAIEFADDAALPSYAAGTYPSVKVTRSIKAGKNTLVLPFSMTEEQVKATFGDNAKVYTVSKFDNDNITFASQTTINANEPCILVSENAVSELNLTNVAVAAATANPTKEGASVKMIGSYAASTEIAADANNYVVSGNELWLVEGSAVTMKGTRAYIQIEVSGTAPSRLTWSFDEADATAIDEIVNGQSVNGQSIYNLQGQRVNSLQRGINIVGGKKVLVK